MTTSETILLFVAAGIPLLASLALSFLSLFKPARWRRVAGAVLAFLGTVCLVVSLRSRIDQLARTNEETLEHSRLLLDLGRPKDALAIVQRQLEQRGKVCALQLAAGEAALDLMRASDSLEYTRDCQQDPLHRLKARHLTAKATFLLSSQAGKDRDNYRAELLDLWDSSGSLLETDRVTLLVDLASLAAEEDDRRFQKWLRALGRLAAIQPRAFVEVERLKARRAVHLGSYEEAERLYNEALTQSQRRLDRAGVVSISLSLCELLMRRDRVKEAKPHLEYANKQTPPQQGGYTAFRLKSGEAYLKQGDCGWLAAAELWRDLTGKGEQPPPPVSRRERYFLHLRLGNTLVDGMLYEMVEKSSKNILDAESALHNALQLSEAFSDSTRSEHEGLAKTGLAELERVKGNSEQACDRHLAILERDRVLDADLAVDFANVAANCAGVPTKSAEAAAALEALELVIGNERQSGSLEFLGLLLPSAAEASAKLGQCDRSGVYLNEAHSLTERSCRGDLELTRAKRRMQELRLCESEL